MRCTLCIMEMVKYALHAGLSGLALFSYSACYDLLVADAWVMSIIYMSWYYYFMSNFTFFETIFSITFMRYTYRCIENF